MTLLSVQLAQEDVKANFLTLHTCDFLLADQAVSLPVSTVLSGEVNVTSKGNKGRNVRNAL